jgi:hypothetical protein
MDGFVPALEERRVALRRAIPGVFLAVYDALGQVGRRPVVVPVRGAHCGGCYLRLPPQLDSSIRRRQSLCPCPHCRRLLYSSARTEDGENTDDSKYELGDHPELNSRTPKRARGIGRTRPARQEPHAAKRRADPPPRGRDAHRTGKTRQTSERRGNLGSADAPRAKAKPAKR